MTAPAADVAGATSPQSSARVPEIVAPIWRRSLPAAVVVADLAAGVAAVLAALRLRFGGDVPELVLADSVTGYVPAALVVATAWPGVLAALGAYRAEVVGSGADEMGRVVEAGLTLFAALAAVHLLLATTLAARLVGLAVVLLVLATLAVRFAANRVVHHARLQGRWRHRAVIYGSTAETAALERELAQRTSLGVEVVATCVNDAPAMPLSDGPRPDRLDLGTGDEGLVPAGPTDGAANGHADGGQPRWHRGASPPAPWAPGPAATLAGPGDTVGDAVLELMAATGADLLAIAGGTPSEQVRALAWSLEGTGADLLVAPAVPDLAQQRAVVRRVGGLALLRVEECRQQRSLLVAKHAIDRIGAAVLLVLATPVLAAIALAIKLTSPGPVFYRQRRVGQHGTTFPFLKFRTMVVDAEARLAELADRNESDGLLFKLRDDPRVTPVGRFLRRNSLDELPQLWNVLRGEMSLVGPRPLPVQPDAFVGDARRRLRVRPGITGLWQVSGRSDLVWDDTVALDMHYVDHWSLGLDLLILARTPLAVLRGRGAY